MKILLSSVPFAPSVGGIETVSALLADGLTERGCEVIVVTQTPADRDITRPYQMVRRPSAMQLAKLVGWSDVVFHNNISLRGAWPVLISNKPWVIAHHMWLPRDGRGALVGRVKRFVARSAAQNIAVSTLLATDIEYRCTVIPNPYDDALFRILHGALRDFELVFVGRLVSDKGVKLLLDALALLKDKGLFPKLSIVGTGPEEASLKQQATALGLDAQVNFRGRRVGEALVEMLNAHRFIVIPSVWNEPFGVVALEGAACGCVPIAADGEGLKAAVGRSGVLFSRGDTDDLARKLQLVLTSPVIEQELRQAAPAHLLQHSKKVISERYFEILRAASNGERA